MTIYDLKSRFQDLLRPLCRRLARTGITANQVTVFALLGSLVMGAALAVWVDSRWLWLLLPIWLFARMALNAIDGMLAREHNMQSALGGLLNELGDVVSDTALYLPFALLAATSGPLVVFIVLTAAVTEFAGVAAIQIGASRRYDGPMGKSDRAFVFGLLALLIGLGVPSSPWLNWALGLILLLALYTVFRRCKRALKEANTSEETTDDGEEGFGFRKT